MSCTNNINKRRKNEKRTSERERQNIRKGMSKIQKTEAEENELSTSI